MRFNKLPNVAMAILGALFTLMGAMYLFVASIGTFSSGRDAVIGMGVGLLLIAVACFAFLYSRKLSKVIGLMLLSGFAGVMLWLVFRPDNPTPDPAIY